MLRRLSICAAVGLAAAACAPATTDVSGVPATTSPVSTSDDGVVSIAIPVRSATPAPLRLDGDASAPVPLPAALDTSNSDDGNRVAERAGADTNGVVTSPVDAGSDNTGPDNTGPGDTRPSADAGDTSGPNDGPGTGSGSTPTSGSTGPPVLTTATGPMPASMAVVRGGEHVLLVDTSAGNSLTVAQFDSVVDPEDQVGPQAPRSIDVDPFNAEVWIDECCRPETGVSHRIDLATLDELTSFGAGHPNVIGSGDVVSTNGGVIELRGRDGSIERQIDLHDRLGRDAVVGRSDIDPSGTTIAVEATLDDEPAIVLITLAAGVELVVEHVIDGRRGVRWSAPSFGADGLLRVIESGSSGHLMRVIDPVTTEALQTISLPLPGIVDADVDASRSWWILVDGTGDVHAFDGRELTALPGGGVTAAAW